MKTHLRLFGLGYAAQARILKRLARTAPHPDLRAEFAGKARHDLRVKARAVNLAYGFLRGKTLDQIEKPHRPYDEGHVSSKDMTRTKPDWELVEALVFAHGATYFPSASALLQRFAEFVEGAGASTKEPMSVRLTKGSDAVAQVAVEG